MNAEDILKRQEELAAARSNWDSLWAQIAERVLPRADIFQGKNSTKGVERTERQYDATPALALTRFAAALESMLTPPIKKWHRIVVENERIMRRRENRLWLEMANDALFRFRYAPVANFGAQVHECYTSLGAFGTCTMFVDEIEGIGPRYKYIHLSEIFICENHQGIVDTFYRRFTLTARQAYQKFGEALPDQIKARVEVAPDDSFEFVHAVYPNEDYGKGALGRFDFRSCYVSVIGKQKLREGGYRTFPLPSARYELSPNEFYGRSPAMTVLPSIRMLNEMKRTAIRSAQLRAEPPIMTSDDGALTKFHVRPNAINHGAVDDQGRPKAVPFQTGGAPELTLEMMDQERRVINDANLVSLFQILVEGQREMTATEVIERAREKAALLAPAIGRVQTEFLGPLIDRELDILIAGSYIEEPPEDLRGAEFRVSYESPLLREMMAEDVTSIARFMNSLALIAEIDPKIYQGIDFQKLRQRYARGFNVPEDILLSDAALAALQEQEAAQRAAQAVTEQAPGMAGALKNTMQAAKLAREVGVGAV